MGLLAAMARHAVTVVDARTDAELDAMARVLESLPMPYIAIGSAEADRYLGDDWSDTEVWSDGRAVRTIAGSARSMGLEVVG